MVSIIDDSVFWLSIGTLLIGSFSTCSIFFFKSKCKNFQCCFGLIKVERDIDAEIDEHRIDIEHGINHSTHSVLG